MKRKTDEKMLLSTAICLDVGRGFTPAVNPPQPVILSEAKNLTYY